MALLDSSGSGTWESLIVEELLLAACRPFELTDVQHLWLHHKSQRAPATRKFPRKLVPGGCHQKVGTRRLSPESWYQPGRANIQKRVIHQARSSFRIKKNITEERKRPGSKLGEMIESHIKEWFGTGGPPFGFLWFPFKSTHLPVGPTPSSTSKMVKGPGFVYNS